MTICIGYVDSEAVYLTADSAVTSGQRLSHSFSSFGELQRNEAGITIQEAALKIMRHGNVAAAFAGDAKSAHQIFENFVAGAERMIPPPAAFENAWLSSTEPGQPAKTSALLGYF